MVIEDTYRLTPLQHGMIFHGLAAPGSGLYVQQFVCNWREEMNIPAFLAAWRQIIVGHAVLRTSFNLTSATPHQEVHQDVELPFLCQDWRGLAEDQRSALLEAFLTRDRQQGFQFDQAPLLRHAIFRLAAADYCWVWTSHHALLDGRSRLLVLKEFFSLYDEISTAGSSQLESAYSYRQYVEWFYGKDFAASEHFWRERLSGFAAATPIGIQRRVPRPTQSGDYWHAEQKLRLSERLTSCLNEAAIRHDLTLNTFLQGAWALLLSRYSGEQDVVFGATRAGRHAFPGAESIVGLLINTVPVRVDVDRSRLVVDWLKELRLQWIALRNHEYTPLADVQRCSAVPTEKPLFESLLTFENHQIDAALPSIARGAKVAAARVIGSTGYPLSVAGYLGRQILLTVVYDRLRFEDAAIATMLGHLNSILEAMASGLLSPLENISLISEAERRRLLVEWNDTWKEFPNRCFHELFEEQVEHSPEAVAIAWKHERLTYRELNCRANQVAHRLIRSGLSRERTVAIYASRSPQFIVAIIAIFKAGGAYVPLNPALPDEQLTWLILDSNPLLVITDQNNLERASRLIEISNSLQLSNPSPVEPPVPSVFCLDEGWRAVADENDQNLDVTVIPENLAYVIYTSGTTGRPKGTLIEHRSLVNYLNWINQSLLPESEVALPTIANPAFDASLKQILAPLLRGREVWLVSDEAADDPLRLPEVLQDVANVAINCVPSFWRVVLEAVKGNRRTLKLDSVKYVFLGGEVVSTELIEETLKLLPQVRIWNLYGPTETTANVSSAKLIREQPVTIGRPVDNTRVYILDEKLEPVPVGVTGELHVDGIGLARGYLNQPQTTSEKFVPNPFGNSRGARLYKTGDLARYRSDGSIEYISRLDHQVKVRGFRVELAEVESILKQHPDVADAAVLARKEFDNNNALVAYVVPCQLSEPAVAEIGWYLRARLPEYAVPSYFVKMAVLPLNALGKLDRQALAKVEPRPWAPPAIFEPASTATEIALAEIWCDVLGVKRVGIRDNFFALGGHSLLAMGVLSRVSERFKIAVPIRTLFERATLASLAAAIDAVREGCVVPKVPAIRPLPRRLQRLNPENS
jgi:amino acid adenylation domain-containing protein